MSRAADALSGADDEARARRDDEVDQWFACHCRRPMPMPVRLFGAVMPGWQECQRCGRPVV
jgi:hypothetical protein